MGRSNRIFYKILEGRERHQLEEKEKKEKNLNKQRKMREEQKKILEGLQK